MSVHDEHEPGAGERAVRDAVRELPRATPDPAFRARLRREFVTGRFEPRRARPAPWFARPPVLLPIAAGALLTFGLLADRGPDWRVIAASGDGRVRVGGRSYAAGESAALSAALRRGGGIRVEGALTLDLAAPGVAAVALGPGCEARLSAAPGRFLRRTLTASLSSGDMYFTTGRSFRGASLVVNTPELSARAVGTSFAVLRHETGSCVCVMEGRVRVAATAAPSEGVMVPEGMRRVVGRDGAAETLPILEESVHHLHGQKAGAARLLER